MGSDNLFRKRKAKNLNEHSRHKAKVEAYDRVLIVCEGQKTEPHYFIGLRETYKLNVANIEITGDCDSDPLKIVKFAKKKFLESQQAENAYNRVYCVFDKDSHTNYYAAINAINNSKPKNTFFSVNSVPCFEYWLLLHFKYTTKSFTATGKNSIADNVIKELRIHLPNYNKGQKNIFKELNPMLNVAMRRAVSANIEAENNSTDNPSTKVVELVEYLINLQK